MSGLIDNTLDELDHHIRELKRRLAEFEEHRRQLSPMATKPPANPTGSDSRNPLTASAQR